MPQFARALDVYQGFNFRKDKQTNIGFINSLKIGTVTLAADITAKDPMAPTTDVTVVAVMSDFIWGLGVTDSLSLNGQICLPNKQSIGGLLLSDLSNVAVEVQLTIYEYDALQKKYFKSFCSDAVLKGLVERKGCPVRDADADGGRIVLTHDLSGPRLRGRPLPRDSVAEKLRLHHRREARAALTDDQPGGGRRQELRQAVGHHELITRDLLGSVAVPPLS